MAEYEHGEWLAVDEGPFVKFLDADRDMVFRVPATSASSHSQRETLIVIWASGHATGEKVGADIARAEIRKALGL